MKKAIFILSFILSMNFFVACVSRSPYDFYPCSVKFTKPSSGQKFIMSPNTLSVTHHGKCWPVEEKFEAWIDKEKDRQLDITSLFNFSLPFWQSESINLPVGNHSLFAAAGMSTFNRSQMMDTGLVDINILPAIVPPIKIMPFGDSITEGLSDNIYCALGYRYWLYKKLIGSRYNIEFIGDEISPPRDPTAYSDCPDHSSEFDRHHEGHRNKTIAELHGLLVAALEKQPDIILMHIGTNDLKINHSGDDDTSLSEEEIDDLVDEVMDILNSIDTYENINNHQIIVFLALIINQRQPNGYITTFNDKMKVKIIERININTDKIILVDMEKDAGLDYPNDMVPEDILPEIHPTEIGYKKMGNLWFKHLANFLPTPK